MTIAVSALLYAVGVWVCVLTICALFILGYLMLLRLDDGPGGPPIWSILLAMLVTGLFGTFAVLQLMHAA